MFEPLLEWLPTCGADIVCVQEVTQTAGLDGWTRFEDAERTLPQRANLFDDIAAALPQHRGTFAASDAGPVWDADGQKHLQDFGIALFVHQRLHVLSHHTSFVHGAFAEHAAWPLADRPRVAQAARVADTSGQSLTAVHLHGLRDPAGKADSPERLAQAVALAAFVEAVREPDDFVVLCGDLNLLPHSETFAVLGQQGLVDLVGTSDTRTSRYTKPVRHANYLLVSDPSLVRSFNAPPEPEVSDHRFLVLKL